MRTIKFQEVYESILRRHGLDPIADDVKQDAARAIVQHVNKRVRSAWRAWDWAELRVVEERAYRTTWTPAREFFRVGENGKPDEFIWLDDMTYYRVKTDAVDDPPAGTLPSDTAYFEALNPIDTYISLDQICRRPIGLVFGVYQGNTRLNGCASGLNYRPSEKGIDVLGTGGPSVFVSYQLPPSRFSAKPYAAGRLYRAGEVLYFSPVGECYIAIADNADIDPTFADWWRVVPFPETFAQYVIAGAYADGLRENTPKLAGGSAADLQMRMAMAQAAEAEALDHLQSEIDALTMQGQLLYYNFHRCQPLYHDGAVHYSEPWTGGTVTTLTEICETDPSYPPQPVAVGVRWQYLPNIKFLLTADGTPSLQALPTAGKYAVGSRVEISIVVDGVEEAQSWKLFSNTPVPLSPSDPGNVEPADFNATTNNVYWAKIA